ncbi:hypothetical protein Fmac_032099 [Flemingia macrophylla]|uniref:Uncharacterized protein n=1 Tax=Flemingia macrophylla TaxID=520843 RepID=A0ABD1L3X7_9FABA
MAMAMAMASTQLLGSVVPSIKAGKTSKLIHFSENWRKHKRIIEEKLVDDDQDGHNKDGIKHMLHAWDGNKVGMGQSFGLGCIVGSPPLFWLLSIYFVLGTAYSIDDIPDMEGDAKHGIRSLSVHLGQKRVLGHALLASILWYRAKSVDLSNNATITSFYMFMWKEKVVKEGCSLGWHTPPLKDGGHSNSQARKGEEKIVKYNLEEHEENTSNMVLVLALVSLRGINDVYDKESVEFRRINDMHDKENIERPKTS